MARKLVAFMLVRGGMRLTLSRMFNDKVVCPSDWVLMTLGALGLSCPPLMFESEYILHPVPKFDQRKNEVIRFLEGKNELRQLEGIDTLHW